MSSETENLSLIYFDLRDASVPATMVTASVRAGNAANAVSILSQPMVTTKTTTKKNIDLPPSHKPSSCNMLVDDSNYQSASVVVRREPAQHNHCHHSRYRPPHSQSIRTCQNYLETASAISCLQSPTSFSFTSPSSSSSSPSPMTSLKPIWTSRMHRCATHPFAIVRRQHITLALFSILLLHLASTINCFDSFNDLEVSQTSLCDAYGVAALGMESGGISDPALSASSSYNDQSVGPQNARLNRELNGGAWCPASQLNANNSGKEWIQVNLTEPYVITRVATQGRFGNGMGVEFAEHFWLNYTRDGINWIQWFNKYGENEIQGNVDTYSIVESVLSIPLVGITALRLMPISQHTRTCCVRFEIYGCPYKDGPISYSMMDGKFASDFGDLIDDTYDGYRQESGFLTGGLGQLVDGIKGDDNYKVNNGFEWIGWRANSHNHLSIAFEFADIRNFTLASFHCHNIFRREMQVFHSAKIWFSLDGRQWAPVAEDFEYMPDTVMEKSRDVVIHLHHRIGRFVKFDLKLASKWILISEVRFDSTPAKRGMLINELDFADLGPITTTAISNSRPILREPIVLIIVAVVIFLLFVFALIFFLLARKRKEKMTGSEYTTVPMKDVASTPLYCEPHDFSRLSPFSSMNGDPEYAVPDLIGNSANAFLNINGAKPMINGSTLGQNSFRPIQPPKAYTFVNANNQGSNANSDDSGKAPYYASTDVLIRSNLQAPIDPSNYNLDTHSKNIDHFFMGNNKINPMVSHTPPPPPLIGPMHSQHSSVSPPSSVSSNSFRGLRNKQPPALNCDLYDSYDNNTQIHSSSTKTPSPVNTQQNIPIPQLKDNDISVIDGQFGYSKYGDCELGYLLTKNEKKLVMLKTLSNEQFRDEFLGEMTEKWRLSTKCNETFANFFGYYAKHDYFAMVIEYGDIDLKKFLLKSSPSTVGYINLIEIASQVSEAMQELHSRGFIHRDLAARNCLIYTSNMKVKISDNGAFMSDYKNEYYNEVLPIRWMSYESILQGKFTSKSDSYSFGVTLWEIMTLCELLPHQHLTEEDILNEIVNYQKPENEINKINNGTSTFYNQPFSDSGHESGTIKNLQLQKPKDCPADIYDLILECCQLNESSRPEFHEIAYFLKKKCLNFRKA